MRENKFRAWWEFEDGYKMIDMEELHELDGEEFCIFTILTTPEERQECEETAFMQCTGLKDGEGNEIYGGDIVEFCDFESLRTGGAKDDTIHVSVVKMSEGSWIVENDKHQDYLYQVLVNDSDVRVIGNIYENPELLVNEGGA